MSCELGVHNPDPALVEEIEESTAAWVADFNEGRIAARQSQPLGSMLINYAGLRTLYGALTTLHEGPFEQRVGQIGDAGTEYVVSADECERVAEAIQRLLADGTLYTQRYYWKQFADFLELASARGEGFVSDSCLGTAHTDGGACGREVAPAPAFPQA